MKRNLPEVIVVVGLVTITICLYVAAAFLPGPSPMASQPNHGGESGYALGAANLMLILTVLMTVFIIATWEKQPRK